MATYDAIVVGTGGVGSAALLHLAQRGARVLGLDRFPGGHDRGSSHGQTRIIRQAYFEHPDYVPLLKRSYQLWADLEQRQGAQLFHQVGLVEIGPPDGVVVSGVVHSARQHQLDIERLSAVDVQARWAGFRVPDGCTAVFEHRAGYLLVERCVLAHLAEARRLGAELMVGPAVRRWSARGNDLVVETDAGAFIARHLVATPGAWAADLLADMHLRLQVLRKHLHWYHNEDPSYRQEERCPTFLYELPDGIFYGFPQIDERGVKVAEHSGGTPVEDPLSDNRDMDAEDRRRVETFLQSCLPQVSLHATHHVVCFYTMSPDEHFIVDRHPHHPQVVFAAGLSGHGFKFTAVLGEVLADLALEGRTSLPIDFLRYCRPGYYSA